MDDKYTFLPSRVAHCSVFGCHVIPSRIDISQRDIAVVVSRFYQSVRADPTLGPIFAAHVDDWPAHEEKINRFWANAILFERNYDGNPMQAHINAGNVQPEHFERWLSLFDETLRIEIPYPQRDQWSVLAHRIGRGLSLGVSDTQCLIDAVPNGSIPMQLATFTDYALRVLMHLAVAPESKLTTRQIADIHDAKYNHLTKVIQWLVNEGYVTSTKGRSGGLQLQRKATEISVGLVVRDLESRHSLVECMRSDGGACRLEGTCELANVLIEAEEAFFRVLDGKTLSQLTPRDKKISALLERLNSA